MQGGAVKTEEQRFFFAHMQKTAGVSLRERFLHHFPLNAIYPGPADSVPGRPKRQFVSVDHLLDCWHRRKDEIRFVHGHFPLSVVQLLDAPFVTLTVLRPPVERTLSLLRHIKTNVPAHHDRPLSAIYEDRQMVQLQVVNHMTRTLGMRTDQYADGGVLTTVPYDEDLLERAKAALVNLDLFGLQPHFEDFCTELGTRYQLDLGPKRHANASNEATAPPALIDQIIADNPLDIALYDYAVDLYAARRPEWMT